MHRKLGQPIRPDSRQSGRIGLDTGAAINLAKLAGKSLSDSSTSTVDGRATLTGEYSWKEPHLARTLGLLSRKPSNMLSFLNKLHKHTNLARHLAAPPKNSNDVEGSRGEELCGCLTRTGTLQRRRRCKICPNRTKTSAGKQGVHAFCSCTTSTGGLQRKDRCKVALTCMPQQALQSSEQQPQAPPAKTVCRRLELGSGCEALAAGIELNELAGAPDGSSWPSADFAMPLTCCSAAPQPAEGGHRLSLCLSLPSPTPQPPTLVPPPTHIHAHTHAHRHSKESPVNKKRQRGEPGEGPACKKKGSILSPCSEQKKQDMRLAYALRTKKEEEKRKEKRARALDKDTTRKKLEQNARTDAFRWDKRVRGDSRPTFNKNGGGFLNTKNMPWSIQNHDASVNCLGHDAPAGFSVRAQKNLMLARQTLPHVPATQQPTPALLARSRLNTQVPSPVELNDDKQSGSTRSRGASVKLSTSVASTDTAMSLDVTCLVKRLCKEILPDEAQGQEHTNFQNVYNRMWPILNSLPWHKDVDMAAISENGMREDVHGLTKTMLTAVEREAASRAAAPIVVDGYRSQSPCDSAEARPRP